MNKRRLLTYALFAFLIFITAVSCSESIFDATPGDRLKPEKHYRTVEDVLSSVKGCFSLLQDVAQQIIIVDGLRSDLMTVTEGAEQSLVDLNNQQLAIENPYLDPSGYYRIIINVNEVLPFLPGLIGVDRKFDTIAYNNATGHLIALRSWAYLMLSRYYPELAYIDGRVTSVDPTAQLNYVSSTEILDTLANQLSRTYDKTGKSFVPMLFAVLGEVYLEKQDYTNAATYLKKACENNEFISLYKVDNSYSRLNWGRIFEYSADQISEVIMAVPYSLKEKQINNLELLMTPGSAFSLKPTQVMVDAYINENNVEDVMRGIGVTISRIDVDDFYISKYSRIKGDPHSAHIIIYRAADMHLLLAEALNRLGDSKNAGILLNTGFSQIIANQRPAEFRDWASNRGIRGRTAASPVIIPTDVTVEWLEDKIIEERVNELAYEGKRFFDLMRIANRRNDPAYLADRVAAKYSDPAVREAVREKLMNKENWYLPLKKLQLD